MLDKAVAKLMSYLQASSLAKNNENMRIQIFELSELNSTGAKSNQSNTLPQFTKDRPNAAKAENIAIAINFRTPYDILGKADQK
jgi:hypothetical protein